jgi:hypothetical protein
MMTGELRFPGASVDDNNGEKNPDCVVWGTVLVLETFCTIIVE